MQPSRVAMSLALFTSTLIVGCQQAGRTPEATAQAFFQSVQALDFPKASDQLYSGQTVEALDSFINGNEDARTIRKALWKRMTYTIGKSHNGLQGSTVVPVRIKTVDMTDVARSVVAQQNAGTMFILEQVNNPSAAMREVTVELEMGKEAGRWKIFPYGDLNSALLGLN